MEEFMHIFDYQWTNNLRNLLFLDTTENLADSTGTEPDNKFNSDELSSNGEDNGNAKSENTSKGDFQKEAINDLYFCN